MANNAILDKRYLKYFSYQKEILTNLKVSLFSFIRVGIFNLKQG